MIPFQPGRCLNAGQTRHQHIQQIQVILCPATLEFAPFHMYQYALPFDALQKYGRAVHYEITLFLVSSRTAISTFSSPSPADSWSVWQDPQFSLQRFLYFMGILP